jgi:AraC-like DNA-binding protein
VNLIVAGCARFGIGERVTDVGPGELLSFPPGQDHVLLEASSDLVLFAIGLKPCLIADVLRSGRQRALLPMHTRPNPAEWSILVQRVTALAGGESPALAVELWQRVHELNTPESHRGTKNIHVLTRRALETLTHAPDLGRDELARVARANPSEVSRFFHRDVGITLVEYRTRLRLLQFIRLVDERASSMTTAAVSSGFGSYSQCHRSFQAELACAPSEFFDARLRSQMEHTFAPLAV